MKSISDRHYEMIHPTLPQPSRDALGFAGMGVAAADTFLSGGALPIVQHAYISVAPGSAPATQVGSSGRTSVQAVGHGVYQWMAPRPLRRIDPTVTFKMPLPFPLFSSYRVYLGRQLMHCDSPTLMRFPGKREVDSMLLHCSTLVPGFWDYLCSVQGECFLVQSWMES